MTKFAETTRSAAEQFALGSDFSSLRENAVVVLHLTRLWRAVAPSPLATACHPGLPQAGLLPVYCDNGAIAARLRNSAARIEPLLAQRTGLTLRIIPRVRSRPLDPTRPTGSGRTLSAHARHELDRLRQKLERGPLRHSLDRMITPKD